MNKIAFLCAHPWENFLPFSFQTCGKEYYQKAKEQLLSYRLKTGCREYVEIYGEPFRMPEMPLFGFQEDYLQLLYIQCSRLSVLEKLFEEADLVIMGLSGSREVAEKLCMFVYPWKEKVLFLWDSHICREEDYTERLVKELKFHRSQFMEIRKGM